MDKKDVIERYHGASIDELCWGSPGLGPSDGFIELSEQGVYVARGLAVVHRGKAVLMTWKHGDISNYLAKNGEKIAEGACILHRSGKGMRVYETGFGETADLFGILEEEGYELSAVFHTGKKSYNALEQMFTLNGRPKVEEFPVDVLDKVYDDFKGVSFYNMDEGKGAVVQYMRDLGQGKIRGLEPAVEIELVSAVPVDRTIN